MPRPVEKNRAGLSTMSTVDALFIKVTAANVYCAKARRQRQMFTARKQGDSGNYAEA
ncbi:hypothetical protein [Lysinibacillus sphaericus]|uniref:hypothetical protein n=1 Tax=Lysinibacillus sphaericus TaxID=1421 RepID=UPI00163BEC93|nr:hypothetical protein [Lysinibacillus sp. SDF0037]